MKKEELRGRLLERFDANKDGKLDETERAAAREAMAARREAGGEKQSRGRGEVMKQFDTDNDGRLSESERAAMQAKAREKLSGNPQFMQRWDKNADGKLDDAEWSAAREQHKGAGAKPKRQN